MDGRDHDAGPEAGAVLAHAPSLFFHAIFLDGLAQKFGRTALLQIFLGKESRIVQAKYLIRLVSLDALGAGVPGEDVALAIEHIDGILADTLDDGAQPRIIETQRLLRRTLLRGVADESHHCGTVRGFNRLEHNVDWDFRAVFAQPVEVEGRAHLPRARVCAVVFAMPGMAAAEARRHQHFYRLADQLFARVTE